MQRVTIYCPERSKTNLSQVAVGRNELIMTSRVEFLNFVQPLRQALNMGFQILVTANSIITVCLANRHLNHYQLFPTVFLPNEFVLYGLMEEKFYK